MKLFIFQYKIPQVTFRPRICPKTINRLTITIHEINTELN
jgi:hypothetical protein